jgi:hypothetical protein
MKYSIGGFSNILSAQGKNNFSPIPSLQVGRVYGVVTTENTPSEKMFKKAGGFNGIGSIFYLDYNSSKNITGTGDEFLDLCNIAKPMSPQVQYYPVLGELVSLVDAPSPDTQLSLNSTSNQKYYTSVVNLWNNNQQNSQPADIKDNLGITFVENPNIKSLLSFEGDHIVQGRQGNALRFSSTTKLYSNLNEWSNTGNDDSPITILSNGFSYNPKEKFHVEKINQDNSSIYLTSTQQLPLQTDRTGILNPLTKPIDPSRYFNAQVIINSDRVVLNSKRDEVMIFAKSNIELSTKNIINLNANERVHLNSNTVFLGTVNNSLPTEPLVLGDKLNTLLENLLDSLYIFGSTLSSVVGSPEGAPAIDINMAAEGLLNDLDRINNNLEGILSQQNFTA